MIGKNVGDTRRKYLRVAFRFKRDEGRGGRKDLGNTKQVIMEGRMKEKAPCRLLQKGNFKAKKSGKEPFCRFGALSTGYRCTEMCNCSFIT